MKQKKDPKKEIESAHYLIESILKIDHTNCQLIHLKQLLSVLLWKITEANGKYNLRYVSKGVLVRMQKIKIIHEHVYEREKLINDLISGKKTIQKILENAVACLVTVEEAELLSKVDKKLDGWERYYAARITVFDKQTLGKKISFDKK